VRKIIRPDFKFLKFWPNIFVLFFLLFSALSLVNSGEYLSISLHALLGKWLRYLCIYIVIQDCIYDQKIVKRGIFVFLCGAALAVFSGLSQYFFGFEFLRNRSITATDSGLRVISASFGHYNDFGGYLVVVLSILFVLLISPYKSRFKVYSLLVLSIFSIAAIFFTLSRGSWVALAVVCILISFFSGNNFKRLIPIFIMLIAMFLFPVFYERLLFAFKDGGDKDRFKYWMAAWQMIKAHPLLGNGVGTFMANFSKYLPNTRISYAHNCYLQIWAETGVFSLASLLAFVGSFIYLGFKKFIVSHDFLLFGLLVGVAGFLVHASLDTNLYSLRLAFLFWVLVGLIVARTRSA
jgi:O-antigen ligase